MAARAESKRVRFNQSAIEKICPPESGRVYVFDTETPALAVCVTCKGARTFYLSRRIGGTPKRIRLGRYPEMNVAQARKAASRLNSEVADGKDPHAERQIRRGSETLEDVFDRFIEAPTRRRQPKAPRTVEGYREQWERHLAQWSDRKLAQITHSQVDILHADIGRDRPFMANRVIALLSALFEFAIRDGAQIVNPTRSVEKYPEPSRDRAIQPSEMPDFLKAIKAEPDVRMSDYFLLLLYTGARRRNVESARWDEIDLKRRVWTPTVKGNRPHTIPLVDKAVALLKRREKAAEGSAWIFPARGRTGHVVEPRPQWRSILKTAELSDLRIQDVRRTLASWMADTGSTETIIGAVLGHSPQSVTGVYARVTEDAKRQAMQTAVTAMLGAKGGKK